MSVSSYAKENQDFFNLLDIAGLNYVPAPNLISVEARDNPIISYEMALTDKNNKFEVRYVVRPISMLDIEYKDAHSSAPTPNHIFPLLFQTLTNNLSDLSNSSSKEYSPTDAKKFFNADWAAVSLLNVNKEFSNEFEQLLLIAIHKDDAADAFILILFNDYNEILSSIDEVMNSLKFK